MIVYILASKLGGVAPFSTLELAQGVAQREQFDGATLTWRAYNNDSLWESTPKGWKISKQIVDAHS